MTNQSAVERAIVADRKLGFTLCSYAAVLAIFVNLQVLSKVLPAELSLLVLAVGIGSSLAYFLINGVFLGHLLFEQEPFFMQLILGNLVFLALLGFTAWLVIIPFSLDATMAIAVLLIGTTTASLLNRVGYRLKRQDKADVGHVQNS